MMTAVSSNSIIQYLCSTTVLTMDTQSHSRIKISILALVQNAWPRSFSRYVVIHCPAQYPCKLTLISEAILLWLSQHCVYLRHQYQTIITYIGLLLEQCPYGAQKIGLMQVPNNYETDLIYPIIARAAELANVNYQTADDQVKTYLKVCTPFLFGLLAQV